MHLAERLAPEPATRSATLSSTTDRRVVITAKPGNILRLPAVEARVGLKKSTWYAAVRAGVAPSPVQITARAVGWREEDIDNFIAARVKVAARTSEPTTP